MPAIDLDQYTGVKLHKDGKVLTATLTNPEKRNAMTPAMSKDLDRLWGDVDRDDDVYVVVLTGAGDAFCAGVDLGNVSCGKSTTGKVTSRALGKEIRDRFWKMLDCETPIISKVRGPAYGLGASICLSADIVVASENARFADSHVRMGIAAGDGGVALWPLLVGFHRAKEFLMLGDVIPARRAEEIGLINHCVPDDELDAFVDEMARRLADGAPRAISWTKLAMNIVLKQLTAGAFEASVAYDMMTLRMDDAREGSTAFMEKRAPRFTGD